MHSVGNALNDLNNRGKLQTAFDLSNNSFVAVMQNLQEDRNQPTVIKKWRVEQGTLQLLAASHHPLSAQYETDQKVISIGRECIAGIPACIEQNPSQLEKYLKDTYVRLVPVGQEEYHIQVSHGLKGGMEEEKVPSNLFRRQMAASSSSASSSSASSSSSSSIPLSSSSDSQSAEASCSSGGLPSREGWLPKQMTTSSSASSSISPSSSSSSSSSQAMAISSLSDVLPFGRDLPPELVDKLKMAVLQAKQAQGKDIIAFVGVTGSGKSTAINHLLGCEMEETEVDGKVIIDAKDQSAVFTKIGHKKALSETEFTMICQRPDFPYVFADCGGFLDTRGEIAEILTSVSMKLTLENAKSVKVVLCVSYPSLMDQRAIGSLEALRALSTLLLDIDACKHSVVILLTQPPMIGLRRSQRPSTVEDAKQNISGIIRELKELLQKLQVQNSPDAIPTSLKLALYQFLMRDDGKYLAVYDPLEDACRAIALSLFDQMEPIAEPKGKFRTPLSDRTALHLSEQITGMAGRACPLYEALLSSREGINDIEGEIDRLTKQMQSMNRLIEEIGRETHDPEQIKAQQNAMREEQTHLINQHRARIAQIDEEAVNVHNELNEILAQIADKEAHGDDPEVYLKRSINNVEWDLEKGVRAFSLGVSYCIFGGLLVAFSPIAGMFSAIASKNGARLKNFIKGARSYITSAAEIALYLPINAEFRHNSPAPLLEVRLSPLSLGARFIGVLLPPEEDEKQCWFDEVFSEDRTSHSIRLTTESGYAVEATVEYIVRKKDIPNAIVEMNALRQQQQQLQDRLVRLTQSKTDVEAEIRAAEEVFNAAGTALENLEQYKAFRDTYPQRIQDLDTRLTDARAEETLLQQQIEVHKTDFQFARDYLVLSGDAKPLANGVIKRFLDLDQRIQDKS